MSVPMPPHSLEVPALSGSERIYQRVLGAALFCLGFFVLFSTAGTSLSLLALIVLAVVSPRRVWATRPWKEPVVAIGLVLLAYIALRTFAGAGIDAESVASVNRYHELLMIPLLWALMRTARRPQAFANGLMLGAIIYSVSHWLAPLIPQLQPFLFTRRISAGFCLAICAFLLFEHARLGRLPAAAGYGAALLLSATVVFASDGRTGHVVLMALLVCAAFRAAPRRVRMAVVVVILVAGMLIAGASNPVRLRVAETLRDAQSTTGLVDSRSSTSTRVEMLRIGGEVASRHWLVGTGWADYARVFWDTGVQRRSVVPSHPAVVLGSNPHNEYLLQLGAGGLPALLLYLMWLAAPIWPAVRDWRQHRPWTGAVGCLGLAFVLGSMFNSVLLDFVEGHFYGALLAWLLVRRVED